MAGGLQKKKREGAVKVPAAKGKALPGKKKKRGTKVPPISGY